MAMSALFINRPAFGQTIDVHCHNILPKYMAVLEKHGAAMEETFPLPGLECGIAYRFPAESRNRMFGTDNARPATVVR